MIENAAAAEHGGSRFGSHKQCAAYFNNDRNRYAVQKDQLVIGNRYKRNKKSYNLHCSSGCRFSKIRNYFDIILYNFRQLSDYAVVLCHNVGHNFQITIPIHTMHRLKHFRRCIFILCMELLSTGYVHCTCDVYSVWTTYFSFCIVSFTSTSVFSRLSQTNQTAYQVHPHSD